MTQEKLEKARQFSVAPMMDWTDRHCRYFHRILSPSALLYTEMVTAPAVIHGNRDQLLSYHAKEHPVAVQLGGSDPKQLFEATEIALEYGYDEINLNVGCPSDRVQSGAFGAVLMKSPDLVMRCVEAMQKAAKDIPVTVKCRIGVDDQEPREILPLFLSKMQEAGLDHVIIHARKAWLEGLSPKENRDIPPLDYDLIFEMVKAFPKLKISLNGGISDLSDITQYLDQGLVGVMLGRAAYHQPSLLLQAERLLFNPNFVLSPHEAVLQMQDYIEARLKEGVRLNQITRHMLGLFHGQSGARYWRRFLSENAHKPEADWAVVETALSGVSGE